jgi:hypothetical protein
MTLDELEDTLPWGLHDAYVERMTIDWTRAQLTLDVRVMIGEHQETDRRARIVVSGLDYFAMEPPRTQTRPREGEGIWVLAQPVSTDGDGHPPLADGCFRHRFYVNEFNSRFDVVGRTAALEWLESEPQPARASGRAYHPGEEIPDPE